MIMTDEPITQTAAATPLVGLLDRIALEEQLKLAAEIQRRLLPTIPAEVALVPGPAPALRERRRRIVRR